MQSQFLWQNLYGSSCVFKKSYTKIYMYELSTRQRSIWIINVCRLSTRQMNIELFMCTDAGYRPDRRASLSRAFGRGNATEVVVNKSQKDEGCLSHPESVQRGQPGGRRWTWRHALGSEMSDWGVLVSSQIPWAHSAGPASWHGLFRTSIVSSWATQQSTVLFEGHVQPLCIRS
jgi:hypothetical protein